MFVYSALMGMFVKGVLCCEACTVKMASCLQPAASPSPALFISLLKLLPLY